MITKYISKYLLVGSVCCGITAVLTSCDDLFEPAIENNQDISEMYTNPEFARGLIDNAFLALPYSGSPESDVATDDAVSNDNSNSYKQMATGSWTSQMNPVNQWENRYHAIQYCNLMLENCDHVTWDYSSESLNQMHNDLYKGNAYALRALHLFYLLRAHCGMVGGQLMGVPIHLASENSTSDFNQPRNTFKECIDQINADFDEALKYLPEQYGDVASAAEVPAKYKSLGADDAEYNRAFGSLQRGKIDARIIAAMKAQVALFAASPAYASASAATYEQAAQLAAAYLSTIGGVGGMQQDGWRWFNNTTWLDNFGATDVNPNEIVWRANVDKNHSLEENNYPPSLYGKGRVNPTQNLVDAFPMANGYPIANAASGYDSSNPYANRDPRLMTYILVNGEKQGAIDATINTAADATTLDGLNRENGASTKTGYYLRKLLRSDMNLDPSQSDDAKNKAHLAIRIRSTEIFLDYAEAANEAQGPKANVGGASYSAYDVIKANLTEGARGVSISANAAGGLDYKAIDVEARSYQDYMIYGPIPYTEILKWSNLQQNDGWK